MANEISRPAYSLKTIGKLKVYYRDGTCDEEILQEYYQQSRFFVPEYEPSEHDTVLDIGAHIGVFSILAAEKVKMGRVYSIEADERNYRFLRMNVESNNLSNVSTHLLALTDYRGTGKLYSASDSWGHTLCEPVSEDWEIVKTDTLTNFLVDNNIQHVDYMKVNVEGAEYSILLHTPISIMKRIELMLVEFHPSSKHNEKDLVGYLEQCGFSTRIIHDATEGKGWIIAR